MLNVVEEQSAAIEKLADRLFRNLSIAEQELLRQTHRIARSRSKPAVPTSDAEGRQNAVRSLQLRYDVSRSRTRERKPIQARVDMPWQKERSVRSDLLRWLCVDRQAREHLNDFLVELRDSWVQGPDLSHLDLPFPIVCNSSWLPDGIDLTGATISHLDLDGSRITSQQGSVEPIAVFSAEGLSAKGSVVLRGVYAEGEINLIGAGIRGDLSCSRGKFSNPGEIALVLDRAEIRGNVHLREKFAAKGQVRLMGAKIHGDLDCRSGLFVNINGDALAAQGATVSGSVFLCEDEGSAFEAKGRVCLDGADIQGDLNCRGSKFKGELRICGAEIGGQFVCTRSCVLRPKGWAINADRAKIGGAAILGFLQSEISKDPSLQGTRSGFSAIGELRFFSASIGNNLILQAGRCRNSEAPALNAEHAKIGGSLLLRFGFKVEGEVRLFGAEVGDSVECDGATLCNRGRVALNAERATIAGSMLLRSEFDVKGEVRLFNSRIGGTLECRNGTLRNPGQQLAALRLERTTIGGVVDLSSGFHLEGNVSILSTTINRNLNLSNADISAEKISLRIRNTEIKGFFGFENVKNIIEDNARPYRYFLLSSRR